MNEFGSMRYGVAAIRASSVKQGTDGDSPESQKEQIEQYAKSHNILIKKYFVFLESASKEQQPMQEVIDYCKKPENAIDLIVIKSIDRFTRGGSYSYDGLKRQLDLCNVELVDIYGVISNQKINTLDHLGFQYRWSVYSPSKKSEILEAERAKDEMRDIMSRMIGAEIRYTQMGYWMRQPPHGYISEKIETQNGKRCILLPHPTESQFIIKMFQLCARGTLNDHQIADEINKLGFQTPVKLVRDINDRTNIIARTGGCPLTAKMLRRYVQKTVYTGVIKEKWTQDKPIKAKFDGLVSFELFNQANNGKMILAEKENGEIIFSTEKPAEHLLNKGVRNPDFPYKKVVSCPYCHRTLLGSASRGKLGKYYPAYHCSNHGHYFRIPQKEFDAAIINFVKSIAVSQGQIEAITIAVTEVWQLRQLEADNERIVISNRIENLRKQAGSIIEKMRYLSSEIAIKYMEEDLVKIEAQIAVLEKEDMTESTKKQVNINVIVQYVKYFMEHLEDLLINLSDPVNRANYFGVLFNKVPTYQEIIDGTLKIAQTPGVNELFLLKNYQTEQLVISPGIEPGLPG